MGKRHIHLPKEVISGLYKKKKKEKQQKREREEIKIPEKKVIQRFGCDTVTDFSRTWQGKPQR